MAAQMAELSPAVTKLVGGFGWFGEGGGGGRQWPCIADNKYAFARFVH